MKQVKSVKSASKKSVAKKSTAKKASKAVAKKSTAKKASKAVRNFIDPEMKIVKKVFGNPRREGTFGHKSFSLIKNGITVAQFTNKGGRLRDLHWDLDKGHVELKKIA